MLDRRELIKELIDGQRTLIVATVSDDGAPLASYAPFIRVDGIFYLFLSRLSDHTSNLIKQRSAGIMVIEDESHCVDVFARQRVNFQCKVSVVESHDPRRQILLDRMSERFGDIVDTLRALPDFILFGIQPIEGSYVEGFGRAFDITDPIEFTTQRIKTGRE
ncbi:MAG: heme utilization protein HutZ [marine bacterium B5-7]|nr:MAG: heme utilization protein HutZ [marine bacterium B5-7]